MNNPTNDQVIYAELSTENYKKLAEFCITASSHWNDRQDTSVLLFKALAQLLLQNPDRGIEGFSAKEIGKMASAIGTKYKDSGIRNPTAWTGRNFAILEKAWSEKEEGLIQRAQHARIPWLPVVWKNKSIGGQGNESLYLIRAIATNDVEIKESADEVNIPEDSTPLTDCSSDAKSPTSTDITYFCDDRLDVGWFAKNFVVRSEISGWHGIAFWLIWALFALLLTVVVTGMAYAVTIDTSPLKPLSILFVSAVAWGLYITFAPVFQVHDIKVTKAPWWLALKHWDALLEWREPPRHSHSAILMTRYSGECPICGGTVSIYPGGKLYPGRLVGKCWDSPREHVYSFDHITRTGNHLM